MSTGPALPNHPAPPLTGSPGRSLRAGLTAVALALAAVLPFLPSLGGGFLNWDDDRFIAANPHFRGPVLDYLWAALTRVQFEAYQPLHLLAYLPDRLLWRERPAGFHALNLALFGLGVALLFGLLRRRVAAAPAALACLLFAWHPLLVEPVAWITGRKDLVAFVLFMILWRREDRARSPGDGWIGSLILTAAGLLTKSAFVVAPLLVFAWLRYARGWSAGQAARRIAPGAGLAALVALVVAGLWRTSELVAPARPLAWPLDVAGTLGTYLGRVLWPARLAPIYPALADGQLALAAVFALAAIAAALAWRRLPPPARFAALGFLAALVPVSNAVPLYFRFADRYALYALAALAWPVAELIERQLWHRPARWRAVGLAGVAALLAGEAITSVRLSGAWRDSLSLWTRAVEAQPRAFYAYIKLGESLRAERRWTDASRAYLGAIALEPTSALGFGGLLLTHAEGSEQSGRLPPGRGRAWLARLGGSLSQPRAVAALVVEMHEGGCPSCARVAQWLALRRFPRPDADLLAAAETALRHRQTEMALVFLREVRDRHAPAYRRLFDQATRPGPPP